MSAQPPHPTGAPITGYHSKMAYSFPLEESDAILKASAYHRKDFDRAVIWFIPRAHIDGVTSTLFTPREPTTALGKLDRLPLELINKICLQLDIASLLCFRQINARAWQILNVLHEYRIVITHALNPLRAVLRTQSTLSVTLLDVYQLLCTQKCSLCGADYGDLVYLPTWIRCCSCCLRMDGPHIRVTTAAKLGRVLQLSERSLEKLPRLKTLPGYYTMNYLPGWSTATVYPIHSALSAYREENDGTEPTLDMVKKVSVRPTAAFRACCAFPSYNSQTDQIENGVSCAGCQLAVEEGILTHTGAWAGEIRDMVYSRDGFLKHFVRCKQAQVLWLESEHGTIEPPKWPSMCKNGGYFEDKE